MYIAHLHRLDFLFSVQVAQLHDVGYDVDSALRTGCDSAVQHGQRADKDKLPVLAGVAALAACALKVGPTPIDAKAKVQFRYF